MGPIPDDKTTESDKDTVEARRTQFFEESEVVNFVLNQLLHHENLFFHSSGNSGQLCGKLVSCAMKLTDSSLLQRRLFASHRTLAPSNMGIAARILAALAPYSAFFPANAYRSPAYPNIVREVISALVAAAVGKEPGSLGQISDVLYAVVLHIFGDAHVPSNIQLVTTDQTGQGSTLLLHQLLIGFMLLGMGRFWSDPTDSSHLQLQSIFSTGRTKFFGECMPTILGTATARLSGIGMIWSTASDEPVRMGLMLLPSYLSPPELTLLLLLHAVFRDFEGYFHDACLGPDVLAQSKAKVLLRVVCPAILESYRFSSSVQRAAEVHDEGRTWLQENIASLKPLWKQVCKTFAILPQVSRVKSNPVVSRPLLSPGVLSCSSVGLRNLGNTCFANSCLQMLFCCTRFVDCVIRSTLRTISALSGTGRHLQLRTPELAPLCVGILFAEMRYRQLRDPQLPVEAEYLIDALPEPFNTRTQQDASEVSKILLGFLEESTARESLGETAESDAKAAPGRGGGGLVAKWFQACAEVITTCDLCKTITTMRTPCWDLSIPIPKPTSEIQSLGDPVCNGPPTELGRSACCARSFEHRHLQHLVQAAFDPRQDEEILSGADQFQCETCGAKVDARRATQLVRDEDTPLPPYLTVQLNRFDFSRTLMNYKKISMAVEVPRRLFVPVRSVSSRVKPKVKRGRSTSPTGGAASSDEAADEAVAEPLEMSSYRLLGIVVHSGSTPNSGHYYSVIRGAASTPAPAASSSLLGSADEQWFSCDDSTVLPLDPLVVDRILDGETGALSHLDTPYIAVYESSSMPDGGSVGDDPLELIPPWLAAMFDQNILKARGRGSLITSSYQSSGPSEGGSGGSSRGGTSRRGQGGFGGGGRLVS